jgi:hypothetical protein
MGAKTWMLVYSTSNARDVLAAKPAIDRDATLKLAGALFPKITLEPLDDGSLTDTNPADNELFIGCFGDVSVVAAKEFAGDFPSKLPSIFIDAGRIGTIHLHAMHSVVDWFAFAVWSNGRLRRSLRVSPDSGVMEDIGEKMAFERPYWAGEHPVSEDGEGEEYPLPFHPLELGEAALLEFFGYVLEGDPADAKVDPDSVPLIRFKRGGGGWKFWKRK